MAINPAFGQMLQHKPMTLRFNFKPYLLLTLTALLLAGCANKESVSRESQPLELVHARCNTETLPPKLSCIEGRQFERGDEFEACRLSVEIYLGALDHIYQCSYDALTEEYTALKAAVVSTFNCYIESYNGIGGSEDCGAVEPPDYKLFTEIEGIEKDWGIPECVSSTSLLRNPENLDRLQLELCQLEVDTFLDEETADSEAASFGADPAKRQFNNYLINLQKRIESDAAASIMQFNCKGRAEENCIAVQP